MTSRLFRHLGGDENILDFKEQLFFESLDMLANISYWSQVSALKGIEKSGTRQKLQKNTPKRIPRPGEQKKTNVMSSPEQIAGALGSLGKFSVHA